MDKDRIKTFAEQVYRDMAGTMTVGMAYVGVETGLFRTMAGKGPMLPEDVAAASGLQPRLRGDRARPGRRVDPPGPPCRPGGGPR